MSCVRMSYGVSVWFQGWSTLSDLSPISDLSQKFKHDLRTGNK